MKAMVSTFKQFLIQITKDAILILLCIAPILCGLFFRYGIPFIQELIKEYFTVTGFFVPYYLLFDLLLATLTPFMYCFAAGYVILGEIDDGISRYLAVTPIGKKGYLISRLGIPAVISFVISVVLLIVFKLTELSLIQIVFIAIFTSIMGILEALLVVSIAGNKVEGMAISKLSGLFMLGLPAPFFITGPVQYLLSPLPSFWLAKFSITDHYGYFLVGSIILFVWLYIFYQRFLQKTM